MSIRDLLKSSLSGAYYKVSLGIALLAALAGIVGMIVYGVFTAVGGPVWIRNQYIGLWFATLLLFAGLQGLYVIFKPARTFTGKGHFAGLVYLSLMAALSLLLMIFGSLANSIDASAWSSVTYSSYLYTLITLTIKRRAIKNQIGSVDLSEVKEEPPAPVKKSRVALKIVQVINWTLRIVFIAFTCLLLAGLIVEGVGRQKFRPRGKIVKVPLVDDSGRLLKFHFKCEGPANGPVFMFEGSASHGLADYLGIQSLLTANNRRSCIWDKPGLGYSDYLYTDMRGNFSLVYDNLFHAMNQTPPYVLVGWGGGGALVYDYAARHPELTHSLVFLDVYPAGFEFKSQATLKNWTQAQLDQYKSQQLASRRGLFNLINGLGVPWGLMTVLGPTYKPYPSELADEVNWYFRTAKTWTTQRAFLEYSFEDRDALDTETLRPTLPLNVIMSRKTREQVINGTCTPRKLAPDSDECQYEIRLNEYSIGERERLAALSPLSTKTYCTDIDCGLDSFIYHAPNFTVNALLKLYPL